LPISWFKFVLGWLLCFSVRLVSRALPVPPNIEPVMTVTMPFSKRYGCCGGFLFGFLSIALLDVAVGSVGTWTAVTAVTYGLIGAAGYRFLQGKRSALQYGLYALGATLFYDAVTGVIAGPLLFGQSFVEAFVGQIPFTVNHVVGNVLLGVAVSPLLERWIVDNWRLDWNVVYARMRRIFT